MMFGIDQAVFPSPPSLLPPFLPPSAPRSAFSRVAEGGRKEEPSVEEMRTQEDEDKIGKVIQRILTNLALFRILTLVKVEGIHS